MMEKIFKPKSIALIGANKRKGSVGRGIAENLQKGSARLFYVNPNAGEIFKNKAYKKITDIDENIDLAVIAIPQKFVLQAVKECVQKKVKGIIIISSGFSETGKEGEKIQNEIVEITKKANISLVGPNTLGIIRPTVNFNASFAPGNPPKGGVAFIAQSGGLIDAIIDGALEENFGFSIIVSVGNAAGISLSDYVDFAEKDKFTKVIALYIEGVENGRDLFNVIKKTKKPVVVIKGGKARKAKEVISSHTGSLAGEYDIFSAAMRQAGAIETDSLEELFDVVKALVSFGKCKKGVGVVTNGGGAGVLITDYIYKSEELFLPEISKKTIRKIEKETKKARIVFKNPLDILGDALPERYEIACRNLLFQENVSSLVVIQTPQIMTSPLENAKKIAKLKKEFKKPIITVFMGRGDLTKKAISYLEKRGVPNYSDPKRVVKPLLSLLKVKK